MGSPERLHHNLLQLPQGKKPCDAVAERHEIALLFDCSKSNPNGDPDTGNMPRVQPDSLKGLVTDVCLKRKVRNFFSLYQPDGTPRTEGTTAADGYQVFIRENAILKDDLDRTHQVVCVEVVTGLLRTLAESGFLTKGDAGGIADELAKEAFDEKPEKCAEPILKACKGKLSYAQLPARLHSALQGKPGFPQEVLGKLAVLAVGEDVASDEAKARKAVTEACRSACPRGDWREVKESVDEALDSLSPGTVLKQALAGLSLEKANRDAICRCFFDVRAFGAVVSTKGPLEGSFYGQIRGPAQFTFSESLDKVLQIDATITRCARASSEEAKGEEGSGNRTMGRKHGIDYGLYRCHIHFSPAFAAKTGFSYYDLDNFLLALVHLFDDDHAAGRHLRLVGLVDFQHQSSLGNAPAHKLLDLVKVEGVKGEDGKFTSSGSEFPRSLADYRGTAPGGMDNHQAVLGYGSKGIVARRLVWEFAAPDQLASGPVRGNRV